MGCVCERRSRCRDHGAGFRLQCSTRRRGHVSGAAFMLQGSVAVGMPGSRVQLEHGAGRTPAQETLRSMRSFCNLQDLASTCMVVRSSPFLRLCAQTIWSLTSAPTYRSQVMVQLSFSASRPGTFSARSVKKCMHGSKQRPIAEDEVPLT